MKNKKSLKYGTYAVVFTAIVIAFIVLVNAILGLGAIRPKLKVDLTKEKLFSIGAQTQEILNGLSNNVEIIVLTPENKFQITMLKEIFEQYKVKSNGKVAVSYVDLDLDPRFIKRELDPDKITGVAEGDIVVRSDKRMKLITENDMLSSSTDQYGQSTFNGYLVEQAFTGAIKNVTAESTPVVYFVTGHGELDLATYMTSLRGSIEVNNYDVKETTLLEGIPEDAAVLAFVEPVEDLLPAEAETLLAWLDKGGDAIFMAGANVEGKEFTNFNKAFVRYNLQVSSDSVYEDSQTNYVEDKSILIPIGYENEIVTSLDQESMRILLPNSRSIQMLINDKEWVKTVPIFITSQKAYRFDISSEYKVPEPGQFALGASSVYEGGTGNSKVVLIGNSLCVNDAWLAQAAQLDNGNGKRYFVSMLNWMQDKQNDITISAKGAEVPPLNITEGSRLFVFVLTIAVIPLLIMGFGFIVWMRRRHL